MNTEEARPALGPMPADVAAAIVRVMKGIRTLGKDDRNNHGGYDFVSTDKFLAAVNPLCAEAGLVIVQNEVGMDIRPADDGGKKGTLFMAFDFHLAAETGATFGPVRRSVAVQALGAQSFGTGQSYALKQFMRSLFQISTGDKDDADLQPAEPLPAKQQARQPAPVQKNRWDSESIRAALGECKTEKDVRALMADLKDVISTLPDRDEIRKDGYTRIEAITGKPARRPEHAEAAKTTQAA